MRRVVLAVTVLGTIILASALASLAQVEEKAAGETREARLAWEALVKAKGGRQRLESISNILIADLHVIKGKNTPSHFKLMVLPHWVWRAYRADGKVLTYRNDSSKPLQEWGDHGGVSDWNKNNPSHEFAVDRLIYLLETRYEKPVPQKVTRRKIGRKTFDVIQTVFDKERIDYYYEPEEMLVKQVVLFYDDGSIQMRYDFTDYKQVDGIWMHQKESRDLNDGQATFAYQFEFQFNVDYDPELFTKPLKATTLDAWKRKAE